MRSYDDRHTGLPFLEKKDDPKLISIMANALSHAIIPGKTIKAEQHDPTEIHIFYGDVK